MSTTASTTVKAYGSTIGYATITAGTAGTYTKVAQTYDIASPKEESGDINVTNNDSPNNRKEYVGGMVEPGTVDFNVKFFASGHIALFQMNGDGITRSWQETFKDGTTCTFPGYVKTSGVTGKTEDGVLEGEISLKVTGPVVWAAGSPG